MTREQRLDHASHLLFRCIAAAGELQHYGAEFYAIAATLDRSSVVEHAAARLHGRCGGTLAQAERAIWCDAERLFGWRDLARLDPRGRA